MSVRTGTVYWLGVILDAEHLDPTETLLLIALADHVDEHDTCWPGIERLAQRARVSYVTARRRLEALAVAGAVKRERRRRDDGNLSVYEYTLQREWFGEPPLNLSGGHRSPGRALTIAHQDERAEVTSNEPPITEQELDLSTPTKADMLAAAFEDFWSAYPRKTAKGAARKAWKPACAKVDSPDVIVEGAAAYAADPNRDDRFTAHASTWLNGERWADPALPSRTGKPAQQRYGPQFRLTDEEESRQRAQPAGRVYDL